MEVSGVMTRSEAQKREITELRAQLARCVDVLTWCGLMFGVNDMPKCQETIHDFIDVELYEQAKADAEVLRCADKIYAEYFYGNDDEKALRHNRLLVRSIHNAVRAAKEFKSELR